MPNPIEPKSGLTMTSEPRSSNASSASSARSQATVRGVGTPAAASSAEVRNLSMVCSIAGAPLTARPPAAAGAGRGGARGAGRPVAGASAGGGQRVQRVDAEDDLLERAARDRAHDHDVA